MATKTILEQYRDEQEGVVFQDVLKELHKARDGHRRYNSVHEAYAVLLEEVDEFWDEVKKRRNLRDPNKMRAELVQVAAVAIRAIVDLCFQDESDLTAEQSNEMPAM